MLQPAPSTTTRRNCSRSWQNSTLTSSTMTMSMATALCKKWSASGSASWTCEATMKTRLAMSFSAAMSASRASQPQLTHLRPSLRASFALSRSLRMRRLQGSACLAASSRMIWLWSRRVSTTLICLLIRTTKGRTKINWSKKMVSRMATFQSSKKMQAMINMLRPEIKRITAAGLLVEEESRQPYSRSHSTTIWLHLISSSIWCAKRFRQAKTALSFSKDKKRTSLAFSSPFLGTELRWIYHWGPE